MLENLIISFTQIGAVHTAQVLGMQILEFIYIFQLNFSLNFLMHNIRLLDPTVFYYNAQQIIQFIQISVVKSINHD